MEAHASDGPDLLTGAVIILVAAVAAVPLARMLKLGSIVGYLIAGVLIGPFVLGLIPAAEEVLHFSELGVVMLLFLIGLELKPRTIWAMRKDIFGLGLAEVIVVGAAGALVAWALGLPEDTAIIVGLGLALSSTAFVIPVLEERGERNTVAGRKSFSILLLQDLAIVPLLALVTLLAPVDMHAGEEEWPLWQSILAVIGAIVGLILIGRFVLTPLFRLLARLEARDVFAATALLIVLGAALLMRSVGMSMAMGAFLAGVMLAESSYRHQLEADIEPYREILLALFFVAVGMSIDLNVLAANWWIVLVLLPCFMIAKAAIIFVIGRLLFGLETRVAAKVGALLAGGGEFAFVLFGAATTGGLLDATASAVLIAAVTLSMAATPFLVGVIDRALTPREADEEEPELDFADNDPRVILVGYGRFGQILARVLTAERIGFTAIDKDANRIETARQFGYRIYYGDVARADVLRAAGADKADLIALCIDDPEARFAAIAQIREEFPQAALFARSYDRVDSLRMMDTDVTYHIRETIESAIRFSDEALAALGVDEEDRERALAEFRERDEERLNLQHIRQDLMAGADLFGRD
ncbi:MAG: monovalent cation:proton antiporter-2 (CPA2) family protein [Pseudomonadota bacterium]